MHIKRMTIVSVAALGLFSLGYAAYANPAAPVQAAHRGQAALMNTKHFSKVSDGRDQRYWRNHHRRRLARSRHWHHEYSHGYYRESGPPYSSCFMKCINSGHPADFCQNVARDHFCF
jgi:hypothetical protein